MNTTARIRSMCNELNEPFILSEDFMQNFEVPVNYQVEKIGTIELKGKSEPTKLYSLRFE
jgi:adenylate cyclase